ncbi:MAG: hypothetical protein JEZ07_05785 [Phycisphaerae bacterium]|nr:hypothetical protein [Phycisphaerae bacterium]
MAVMHDTKTEWLTSQAQSNTTLASYFEDFTKIYQSLGPSETVQKLTRKCQKIHDEIRYLSQGINFFENVLFKTNQEMPEIQKFKARLQDAKKEEKALELTINCISK